MTNPIVIKRSAVPAKVPTTSDLALGELALNTYDGKLYMKTDSGTPAIVEIGATPSFANLTGKPTTISGYGITDAITSVSGTTDQISASTTTGAVTVGLASDPVIPGNARIKIPASTTANRPGTPVQGDFRFNTTLLVPEVYDGTVWDQVQMGAAPGSGASTVKQVTSGAIAAVSGNTVTPYDNTTPTSSEGIQIWTKSFTPTSTDATVLVNCSFTAEVNTGNRHLVAAIFRGTTCIGTSIYRFATGNYPCDFNFVITDTPNTTSAVTYSCRVGISSSTTFYINSAATPVLNGTLAKNGYLIMEW